MATTPAPKEPTVPAPAGEEKKAEEKKIGGPDDLILLDENEEPVSSIPATDDTKKVKPFRVEHPDTGELYERAGRDEDGRATYRKSV